MSTVSASFTDRLVDWLKAWLIRLLRVVATGYLFLARMTAGFAVVFVASCFVAEDQRVAMSQVFGQAVPPLVMGCLIAAALLLRPTSRSVWLLIAMTATFNHLYPSANQSWYEGHLARALTYAGWAAFAASMAHKLWMSRTATESQTARTAAPQAEAPAAGKRVMVGDPPRRLSRRHPGFAAVLGMSELKTQLQNAAAKALRPGSPGEDVPNGILLDGDPGNGKTFIVQALARELDLPLKVVTPADVTSQWVGEGTQRLKAVFDEAQAYVRSKGPCILFFDEVESLAAQRGRSNQTEEHGKLVNTFLKELERLRGTGVLFVAATNLRQQVDTAVLREGRLDFKITVPNPDYAARLGLLRHGFARHIPKIAIDPALVEALAKRWEGFSVKRLLAITEASSAYVAARGLMQLDYPAVLGTLREVQGAHRRLPEGTKSLSDMVLAPHQRGQLRRLASQLNNSFHYEAWGGSLPSGVLLYGPPGTGKTAVVKALAKESGWFFVQTTGTDLMNKPGCLDELVRMAKDFRPCVVFIDEAENLLADRGTFGPNDCQNKLLSVMDGAGGKLHDVLWIAATNHPDRLDDAVTRGGRFSLKIGLQPPDRGQLEAFATEFVASKGWAMGAESQQVTDLLAGKTPADVQAILQEAINMAIDERHSRASGAPQIIRHRNLEQATALVG